MKLYRSLSEAVSAFQRRPREVFAILSFNSEAYFVFRSKPTPEKFTMLEAKIKMAIGNDLKNLKKDEEDKIKKIDTSGQKKLYKQMVDGGVPERFPQAEHAEESLIRQFPAVLNEFKAAYKNEKINNIDILLTHSPCSPGGRKHNYSAERSINNLLFPAGCEKKLSVFFKKEHYKELDKQLFDEKVKVKVRYNHTFDSLISYEKDNFIKEADPILKEYLSNGLDNFKGM